MASIDALSRTPEKHIEIILISNSKKLAVESNTLKGQKNNFYAILFSRISFKVVIGKVLFRPPSI